MPFSRRHFCASTTALALSSGHLRADPSSRVDVAAIEHDHIIFEASLALKQSPRPITTVAVAKHGDDPHNFFTEPETPTPGAHPYRAHADALVETSASIAALTAAYVLTKDERYALHAGKHLYAWLVDPATRVAPDMPAVLSPAIVTDLVPLAEIARAFPFLADTAALYPPDMAAARDWFRAALSWLNTARPAFIAREARDHTASAWLLLATSFARLLGDDTTLNACRIRFKKPTLRYQVNADGDFPHEVASPYPYRNSMFNFDLLAAACDLLSTPFSSLWSVELDDGPGMRAVAAFLFPFLKEPARWPYLADADHFRGVPRRRPGLLFAGRAYDRPEYIELWRSLPQPSPGDPLLASFPFRQPLLWTSRIPHGA